MKKLIILLVLCLIFSGLVLAEKGGVARKPDDSGNEKMQGKPANVTGSGLGDQDRNQTMDRDQLRNRSTERLRVLDRVRNRTQEHKELLEAKLQNLSNRDKQKVFRNHNRVREAVMALLALREEGNLTGGIGQNISAIAREFNNSVEKTQKAEEAIVGRDGLTRFLFGGDENAAAALQAELNQNRVRIQQLERLRLQLEPEYQPYVEEQIRLMQEEQTRLQELAAREMVDKGLLGWLFK